jgi:hypothetical protein
LVPPAAIAIYGAVGTAMMLMEKAGINASRHDPGTFTLQDHMWMLFSIGVVAGPMGALFSGQVGRLSVGNGSRCHRRCH